MTTTDILADPNTTYTTYVIVPVAVETDGHGGWVATHLELLDDGTPGPWGDTYAYNHEAERGEWYFNHEARDAAWPLILRKLGEGART